MFELSVAWKYLLPRRRQLSVSVISLISIFVIALVVWLVVLFFSITNGMERHWITKLIAVTAPVRITPTSDYYASHYYQVDGLSANADYALKSLGQKRRAAHTNPHDPNSDEEIPAEWPAPLLDDHGQLRDLVKETFAAVDALRPQFTGLRAVDYEAAFGNIRLRLLRPLSQGTLDSSDGDRQSVLAQAAIFGSLDPQQTALPDALMPLRGTDIDNVLNLIALNGPTDLPKELADFFQIVQVTGLRTPESGWRLPRTLLPSQATFQVLAIYQGKRLSQLLVPKRLSELAQLQAQLRLYEDMTTEVGELRIKEKQLTVSTTSGGTQTVHPGVAIKLAGNTSLQASVLPDTFATARRPGDVQLHAKTTVQGIVLTGNIPLQGLLIDTFKTATRFSQAPQQTPPWVHRVDQTLVLPAQAAIGDAVLLPKAFTDVGVLVGDRGYLSYQSPSVSTMQEQRLPVYVAGFYDPGMIPIGGKFVLVNPELTSLIRSAYAQEDTALTNGINVSFDDFRQADQVKAAIVKALEQRGLARYWKVETFRQFDFTKELLQQLRSDKNLSMVIASVIILVACSNIVSMLIILVNDKKLEIGILRSMGATSRSIALIFGFCGVVMGLLGSLIGATAAVITLRHLDGLIRFMEKIQGYEIFNPTFYGNTMPSEVSWEGLMFVLFTTTLISILAGIVPAVKASLLKPAAILRSE